MARKDKKQNKKDAVQKMIEYTYRDMGQEFLMRKKMLRAIVLSIVATIALIVFIALYIGETQRVQEEYKKQYLKGVESAIDDIDAYLAADGDYELMYRMILSDVSNANSYAFLLKNFEREQKSFNQIYTVVLKYPEQTGEKMEEIQDLFENILSYDNEAYDKIDTFVESINKKGF